MKKLLVVLLVLAMVFAFAACTEKEDIFAKSEGSMTFAQFNEAALDSEVTVEAFVQLSSYAAAYGNTSVFLQDKDGGYYVYRMNVTEDEAAKLVPGAKIKVTGYKSEWSGEVEIVDATFELLSGTYTAKATDITSLLGKEAELKAHMNEFISIKDASVVASTDKDGNDAPFLYNWDGSGAKGSNNDLYFNVSVNGAVYNLCVESDECAEGTDVYTAVEGLQIGDKISLEGFLYWYNGANPHITKVSK